MVARIKSRHWVKVNVEQEMRMVGSNLIPNLRAGQCPTGTHIPLVTTVAIKNKIHFFLLIYVYFFKC